MAASTSSPQFGEFYKLAFERSSATVVASADEPFTIQDINAKAIKLLSATSAESVRGIPLFKALPVLDNQVVRENLELSKDNPQAASLTLGNIQVNFDHRASSDRKSIILRLKQIRSTKKLGKKRSRTADDIDNDDQTHDEQEQHTNGSLETEQQPLIIPTSSLAAAQRTFSKIGAGIPVDQDEMSKLLPSLVVEGVEANVRFALDHGADPNFPTDASRPFSALYAAVQLGKENIVNLLLNYHASIVLPNYNQPGETPLKLALKTTPSPIYHLFSYRLATIDAARRRAVEEHEKQDLAAQQRQQPQDNDLSSPYRAPLAASRPLI